MSPRISIRLLATQPDQRLVALAREGHERAFEALVHRYRRPLLRYARRMRLSEARAEDVLQQAFMQSWIALSGGASVNDVRSWLYRIVHNVAVNAMRGPAGEAHGELTQAVQDRAGLAGVSNIERTIAMRDALSDVAALPRMQQQAIFLTAVDGQSHDEVAGVLGISEGALRGLLYRARSTLRSAAAALTPPPLIAWACQASSSPATERIAELSAGGGGAGVAALLAKGAVVAATVGAVATGAGVVGADRSGAGDRHSHSSGAGLADVSANSPAALASGVLLYGEPASGRLAAALEGADRRRGRRGRESAGHSEHRHAGAGQGRGDGRGGLAHDDGGNRASSGSGGGDGADDLTSRSTATGSSDSRSGGGSSSGLDDGSRGTSGSSGGGPAQDGSTSPSSGGSSGSGSDSGSGSTSGSSGSTSGSSGSTSGSSGSGSDSGSSGSGSSSGGAESADVQPAVTSSTETVPATSGRSGSGSGHG